MEADPLAPASGKKVFHTALIISPPAELSDQIQAIRKVNDSAFARWMPHINLSFPFLPPDEFELGHKHLQKEFRDFPSFTLKFGKINYFTHAKKCVVYLQPEVSNKEIHEIQDKIVNTFPFLDDQTKKSDVGFTPHLTLGQFDKNSIKKTVEKLQADFKPIEFKCKGIYLIQREGTDAPFYVSKTVEFKE